MSDAIKAILEDEKKLKEVAKVAFDSVDTDKSGQIDFLKGRAHLYSRQQLLTINFLNLITTGNDQSFKVLLV